MEERTEKNKKRKKYKKFQRHHNNMDDASDGNNKCSNRMNNSFLKNDSYDSKNPKNEEIQRSTIQPSTKTSLVEKILSKKIQPSLSEREWIINQRQRHAFQDKFKIDIIKQKKGKTKRQVKRRDDKTVYKNLAKKEMDTVKEEMDTAKEEIDTAKKEMDTEKEEMDTAKEEMDTAKEEMDIAKEEIDTAKEEMDTAKEETDTAIEETDTAIEETDTANS